VTWTPDGQRVAFGWSSFCQSNLHWQAADGSSAMERLATSNQFQGAGSFSPDGTKLAFVQWNPATGGDILLLDLRSRQVTSFLNSKFEEMYPEFPPDFRHALLQRRTRQEFFLEGPAQLQLLAQPFLVH